MSISSFMSRRVRRFALAGAMVLLGVLVCAASTVFAAERPPEAIPLATCAEQPDHGDGTARQAFDSVEVTGGVSALPSRTIVKVGPGQTSQVCVGFQNRTGSTSDLMLSTYDVGEDRDGSVITGGAGSYGAASWIQLPATKIKGLADGDIAWLVVDIDVPADATAGSWYASIQAKLPPSAAAQGGVDIQTTKSVATQLFFDIPGDAARSGKVVDVRAPRVIWWDGPGAGELPVLKDLRGMGIAPIRFGWHNTGDYTDLVSGKLKITSDLGGRQMASFDLTERAVLRGGTREFEATWAKDIPIVGRFTPTITMQDGRGREQVVKLDPIWVIPSWWYLLAVVLAIGIPVGIRRRNKRQYRELLARVEAAETRGADMDEDSDSNWH